MVFWTILLYLETVHFSLWWHMNFIQNTMWFHYNITTQCSQYTSHSSPITAICRGLLWAHWVFCVVMLWLQWCVQNHKNMERHTAQTNISNHYMPCHTSFWLYLLKLYVPLSCIWPCSNWTQLHKRMLTDCPLWDLDAILKLQFSILFYWLGSSHRLRIMPWDECHGTSPIINQHWFR